ncbi:hypothetical protein Plhal304r1_c005g0022081 [Plasmopara halstedii]
MSPVINITPLREIAGQVCGNLESMYSPTRADNEFILPMPSLFVKATPNKYRNWVYAV